MASDEVTDSIAHIEMHRQEMAKETSLASACNEALRKLHELLKHEQEELQKNGPLPQHTANMAALTEAIERVKRLSGAKNPGPPSREQRPGG
jgi:bacterioferritin-associated ferredoxin